MNEEKLIIERARKLPLGKCYVNEDWKESSMASVLVTRKHVNGNVTFSHFIVDLLCLGVKDAFGRFNFSEKELMDHLDEQPIDFIEIPYVLAHNIIYSGLDYAEEMGIQPIKEFQYARYVLEEDTEDIELIDIECGKDGKPLLMGEYSPKIMQVKAHLERTLGKDNFTFVLGNSFEDEYEEEGDVEDYEDDIFDDEWLDDEEEEEYGSPFNTEKGPPSAEDLAYMEKKLEMGYITDEDLFDIEYRFEDWLFDDTIEDDTTLEDDYQNVLMDHELTDEVREFVDDIYEYTISDALELIEEKMTEWPDMPLLYGLYAEFLFNKDGKEADEYIKKSLSKFPNSFILSAQYLHQLHEAGNNDEFGRYLAGRHSLYEYEAEEMILTTFLEKFYVAMAYYFIWKKELNRGLQYLSATMSEERPDLIYGVYLSAIKLKMEEAKN